MILFFSATGNSKYAELYWMRLMCEKMPGPGNRDTE